MTSLLIQTLVNGLIVGMVYGIIGCSLAVIYGAMRIVNFAHGEFVVAGSYITYVVVSVLMLPFFMAIPIVMVSFLVLGALIYLLIVPRLLRNDDHEIPSFLAMYGVSLIIASLLILVFEADTRSIDVTLDPMFFKLGSIIIPTKRILALGLGVLMIGAIWFVMFRTIHGRALRATIMNPEATAVVGLPFKRVSFVAFSVSIMLAGLTGILTALVFPAFNPMAGIDITLIAFVVIVLGGLSNPVGAIVGGIFFGLVEQLTVLYGGQWLAQMVSYFALIIVAHVLPNGILGGRAK